MDDIESVRAQLREMTQAMRRDIGDHCGIPFQTLQKFVIGTTESPKASAWLRLVAELRRRAEASVERL